LSLLSRLIAPGKFLSVKAAASEARKLCLAEMVDPKFQLGVDKEMPLSLLVLSPRYVNIVTDFSWISVYSACEQFLLAVLFGRTLGQQAQGRRPAMSARAVAVIRPTPNIIALITFLFLLSGESQLHAFRDRSHFVLVAGFNVIQN
jgi:hypothetical protein